LFQGSTVAGALIGVALILAVFGCVVLHELGHALMARRFDVPTRDITLYPIGGVARLQRIPEEPMLASCLAFPGPAVHVAIAAGLLRVLIVTGGSRARQASTAPMHNIAGTLMWLTRIRAGFNMLPAFPMDGGRV